MYLLFFTIILLAIALVMFASLKMGARTGFSSVALIKVIIGVSLIVVPVFWNYLPIKYIFREMCSKDAGYTQFMPAEEWLIENRERISSLKGVDLDAFEKIGGENGYTYRDLTFGGLLESQLILAKKRRFMMDFHRSEMRLVDALSGKILINYVNYSVGPRDDARFWLVYQSCFDNEDVDARSPASLYFGYRNYLRESVK